MENLDFYDVIQKSKVKWFVEGDENWGFSCYVEKKTSNVNSWCFC